MTKVYGENPELTPQELAAAHEFLLFGIAFALMTFNYEKFITSCKMFEVRTSIANPAKDCQIKRVHDQLLPMVEKMQQLRDEIYPLWQACCEDVTGSKPDIEFTKDKYGGNGV